MSMYSKCSNVAQSGPYPERVQNPCGRSARSLLADLGTFWKTHTTSSLGKACASLKGVTEDSLP